MKGRQRMKLWEVTEQIIELAEAARGNSMGEDEIVEEACRIAVKALEHDPRESVL